MGELNRFSLRKPLAHAVSLLGGIATGAGLMYLLDADAGRERRQMAGVGFTRWLRTLARLAGKIIGAVQSGASNTFVLIYGQSRQSDFSDHVLAERVRGRLRHVVSHPGSIQVIARNGRVVLWGPVLVDEPEKLRQELGRMRGVRNLELLLTIRNGPQCGSAGESPRSRKAG